MHEYAIIMVTVEFHAIMIVAPFGLNVISSLLYHKFC